MAVDYLDIGSRPAETPLRVVQNEPAPPALSTPPAAEARQERVVDLTDHAASYWVRRRREQEAARR